MNIKMKPIAWLFFAAQICDCLTTAAGLRLGAWEANLIGLGWQMMVCKIAVIILGVVLLQRLKMPRLAWIIPILSILPVIWNMIVIAFEILDIYMRSMG